MVAATGDRGARRRPRGDLVAGDLGHERRDLLGVLAVDEAGGHLALAASAALLDGVEDERLRRGPPVGGLVHPPPRRSPPARGAGGAPPGGKLPPPPPCG